MPSGPDHRKANGVDNISDIPPTAVYDVEKAASVNTSPAIGLLQALRHPRETIWLQTFADAPDNTYVREERTDADGRRRQSRRWHVSGVPVDGRGMQTVNGIAESYRTVTPAELQQRPYLMANMARVGVYFAVNVMKAGAGRRRSDTVGRVAAVFLDLDGAPLPANFPIQPTAIVESSPGRFHVYWAVDGVLPEEFGTLQKTLAELYGGDPVVHDLARVMRLPGYWHGKKDTGFLVRLVELNAAAQYTRNDLLTAWPEMGAALTAADVERLERQARAERMRAEAAAALSELSGGTAEDQTAARVKYARVMLEHCRADLLAAPVGQRNSTLNAVAFRVGRHVGAYLDGGEAAAVLSEAAEQTGLGMSEVRDTVGRALHDGQVKEPFDFAQVGTRAGKRSKSREGEPLNAALVKAAEAVAGQQEAQGEPLPTADELPAPTGEGGNYSDPQILELLNITWPVTAAHTDLAHAHRLYELAGNDLAFVPALGGYVAWNGTQWLAGEGKEGAGRVEAKSRAQRIGRAMQPEINRLLALYGVLATAAAQVEAKHGKDAPEAKAARAKAGAMQKAYHHHHRAAAGTEQGPRQVHILSEAATLYTRLNPKAARDFEPRPWVVGFPNGVWDRGVWRAARREDHLLKVAAVEYRPDADRSDWEAVLGRITGGDTDLQCTLQDVAGYVLSGASSLRTVPWAYGPGGTGKGTYSEMLASVLGEMAQTISPKHLATDADRERLGAVIWGKRLALCAEAGNQRLDAESIKTLSGGDKLPVRKLYAESFTGRASHVLLMVANDPPRVEAYDDALKDRVLALPFTHALKEGGPLLNGRRLEELRQDTDSGLLKGFTAWAVEGLERVYRNGDIHRAAVCVAATRTFWADVDPLKDFWAICDPSALAVEGVSVTKLRASYEQWAKDNGVRVMTAQKFVKAAESVGLERKNVSNVKSWKLVDPYRFPSTVEADHGGGRC
ncbi:hypothetical protein Daqu01_03369 [Deinococcus aquaticus]